MALATLSIDLVAKMATFEKDLQRIVKVVEGSAGQMSNALALVKSGIAGLAGAFSVGIAVDFVRNTINSVDALNDLKDATGSSVENLSALEDIALRSGNSFEAMASSVVKFNKVLSEAKPGSDMEKTLQSIGLNAAELRKMDPSEALLKTAQALAGYADDGNKARLIQDLFGKSIREAGPWLKDLAEAGALNAKVAKEQTDEAERYNKALANLSKNSIDASRSIIGSYLPALNQILEAFNNGGLASATDKLGNLMFDWEGSQQRKVIKSIQSDLADLRDQESRVSLDIFGQKGAIQAEIKEKTAALTAAQAAYFRFSNVQGGRGNVNPALVDGRPSAPSAPGKTGKSGKAPKEEIDDNARSLAQYVKGLEQATERTMDLTESEKSRLFLTTLGKTGEVAQVRELVLGMAAQVDASKLLADAEKERIAAIQGASRLAEQDISKRSSDLDSMAAANAALRDEIELIGLDEKARAALTLAKQDQAIADAELALIGAQSIEGNELAIGQLEREITLLRQKRGLTATRGDRLEKEAEVVNQKAVSQRLADGIEEGILTGFRSGKGLAEVFLDELQAQFAKTVLRPIIQPIAELGGSLITKGLKSLFGFANGGIMTGAGPLPLRAYATGGVANSPQLAMYGEGSRPEAFVPLPDGRTIPVTMKGGAGRAVVVNISNQIGDVASTATVVKGMQAVRAQIMGELSRGQRMGGAYA